MTLLFVFLLTAAVTFLLTPVTIWLYRRFQVLDDPHLHLHAKVTHTTAVPRGGGLALFGGLLISGLIFLPLNQKTAAILVGGAILTLVGVADDIWDLSPWLRLLVNIGVALLAVAAGIGIAFVGNPFSSEVIHLDMPQITLFVAGRLRSIWVLADIFALLFIVGYMNIINWSTGLDGQMPGFVSITAVFLAIISTRFLNDPAQITVTVLCLIIAGAYAGYLPWNWFPQKSMPGYGGTSLAGFLLAIAAILSGAKVASTVMMLAIPTADAIFTILRRLHAGKSPFRGDRGHLHHKLIDVLGWSKSQVSLFYLLSSLLLGVVSLYLNPLQKFVTMSAVMAGVFVFLVWVKYRKMT